ncbi:MAG: AEC family transporter [Lachnospiraceae bacterium]|nr:AEC family transporter [Lachnospiraceae bacterium]
MSAVVVIKQMIMIALLITVGCYSYKKGLVNDNSKKSISSLIVNFTNPALLVYSMLGSKDRLSGRQLMLGMVSAIVTYAILIILAEMIVRIFRLKKDERYSYWMLCVFGNTGFIGIPLTEAVLGGSALVYVCIHNIIFSILIYTVGDAKLHEAAAHAGIEGMNVSASGIKKLRPMINSGTVCAFGALALYVAGMDLPDVLLRTFDYAGRPTTFLSMVVLGCAVANMSIKRVISNHRLIIFSVVRLIVVPGLILLILKLFMNDALIINTAALMLAVPAGNMPLIMASRIGLGTDTISDGIVLTTILSLITIPLVTLFV